ncbi:MAG: flagellar hook-associated protein FlgL [Candidatus Krumholzibacteriota bacterium]|nr:flagellar hook-associated protein FlgL [Candidatus Krumholzibacteriota bacterium]
MRVTQKMRVQSLLSTINRSYAQMASMDLRRRITKASDDPGGAEQMVRLRALLAHNEQYQQNVQSASRWLNYTDTALGSLSENLRDARELALSAADDSQGLEGVAESLDGIIQQMLLIANTEQGGRFLFAGSRNNLTPFELVGSDAIYRGDETALHADISSGLALRYNVTGAELFMPQEADFQSTRDWDPLATWNTALSELLDGTGVAPGMIRITDGGGTVAVVDLRGALTLGDMRDRIQAALPNLTVSLVDGERLQVTDTAHPGETLHIGDVQGGTMAQALGLAGAGAGGALLSRDLDPALTDATPLTDLRNVALPLGTIDVTIGNAPEPTPLDLSGAVTVGDLRTALNGAFPELDVAIAGSGNRLEIRSLGLVSFAISCPEGDDTARNLGLEGSAVPNRPFGVLLDLRDAVLDEDRARVASLLAELEAVEERFLSARASVGTRLNLAEDAANGLDARNYALTESLSDIGDTDMAEALLYYESAEAIYQASLSLASNIYTLSLANYL